MRVLIIGESCLDEFVYCKCVRLSPEAPVPVMEEINRTTNEGMAANVKQNLNALCCDVVDILTNKNKIVKTRFVENKTNQHVMRLDSNDKVDPFFNLYDVDYKFYDAIVISDYAKGFLSVQDLRDISEAHPLTFLDTKKPLGLWALGFTFIKINETEWENSVHNGALGVDWQDKLIVTLGERGCDYNGVNYPANQVDVSDLSGAGDTFLAGLVYEYLLSKDIRKAILFANSCAGKVVQRRGVTTI